VPAVSGHFLFVCKPQSHPTLSEYLSGVELDTHVEIVKRGKQRFRYTYRWIVLGLSRCRVAARHRLASAHALRGAARMAPLGRNALNLRWRQWRVGTFPSRRCIQAVLDGAGETIAIIELGGGFRSSDLKLFFKEIGGTTPSVAAISVDHAGNDPTSADSADGEVMLDIEVAGAVAPKARFAVHFAPNNGDKGFLDAISAAVHDAQRKPSVISISWGGPEASTDPQGVKAYHELFAAAGALGITVCVASGDHGIADLDASSWDGKIHVDHPACDDLVLGCGGTQVDAGKDVVWNDGTPFDPGVPGGGGWASGGGISEIFAVPSYQAAAKLPVSLDNGKAGRGVPDIAMSATNYFIRVDNAEGASGGTSAIAPLMAALIARLNQAKKQRVGFLYPFLYANAARGVLSAVTSGTNAIKNTVKGYDAGPGWNACAGLGTPDGTAILNNLH
jgi:kumamolisin